MCVSACVCACLMYPSVSVFLYTCTVWSDSMLIYTPHTCYLTFNVSDVTTLPPPECTRKLKKKKVVWHSCIGSRVSRCLMVGSPVSLSVRHKELNVPETDKLCCAHVEVSLWYLHSRAVRYHNKKQRLHINICPEEGPPQKEKRISNPPMSRGLFGFSFHNADTQRHKRKQASHWLLIDPSETRKKTKQRTKTCCNWGWLCYTRPAVTVFNHKRPAFHQEQIQLREKQQRAKPGKQSDRVLGRGGKEIVGWKCLSVFCILSVCVLVVAH